MIIKKNRRLYGKFYERPPDGQNISNYFDLRAKVLSSWDRLVHEARTNSLNLQILLNRLQAVQEDLLALHCESMKKMVIAESAFIAARQYDLQNFYRSVDHIDIQVSVGQMIQSLCGNKKSPFPCQWTLSSGKSSYPSPVMCFNSHHNSIKT